ncbi:MAG: hypothetical protein Q8Q36_02380 [bacterium]|nr:hypothetical protein [bacterium]
MTKRLAIISLFLFLPMAAYAAIDIIPCGGPPPEQACGFNDLVKMANNIVKFLITIGSFAAAIGFAYVGWLFVMSGGDPSARSKAKGIFMKIVIGFVLMFSAWLLVSLIIKMLGYQGPLFLGG